MKLIVGLGNPGRQYAGSRHNIGFIVVKEFSRIHKFALRKERFLPVLAGKGRLGKEALMISLPLTFMNLSGIAAAELLDKYKISPEEMLVVCDDIDLEFGRLKLKKSGSSAGHKGIKSIIERCKTEDFLRLRIGIARPRAKTEIADYVLSSFSKSEKIKLKEIVRKAAACCETWIEEGTEKTMNIFNKRSS